MTNAFNLSQLANNTNSSGQVSLSTGTSGTLSLTTQVSGTLPVLSGGTGVTTSTGSGANVLGTSPTLTTPTFDSASLATISGTAPLYMCRAWVNFNGTGTVAIRDSGNVSYITDNGVGNYTVNFTTAMPDVNYAPVGGVGRFYTTSSAGMSCDINRVNTGNCSITSFITSTNAPVDVVGVLVAIFR